MTETIEDDSNDLPTAAEPDESPSPFGAGSGAWAASLAMSGLWQGTAVRAGTEPGKAEPAPKESEARRSDQIHRCLTRLIRMDALRIGDDLPSERFLCGAFSVARGPVRAALLRMRDEGWVRIEHGRATRIIGAPGRGPLFGRAAHEIPTRDRWRTCLERMQRELADRAGEGLRFDRSDLAVQRLERGVTLLLSSEPVHLTVLLDACHMALEGACRAPLAAVLSAGLNAFPLQVVREHAMQPHVVRGLYEGLRGLLDALTGGDDAAVLRAVEAYLAVLGRCADAGPSAVQH